MACNTSLFQIFRCEHYCLFVSKLSKYCIVYVVPYIDEDLNRKCTYFNSCKFSMKWRSQQKMLFCKWFFLSRDCLYFSLLYIEIHLLFVLFLKYCLIRIKFNGGYLHKLTRVKQIHPIKFSVYQNTNKAFNIHLNMTTPHTLSLFISLFITAVVSLCDSLGFSAVGFLKKSA